MRITGRQAESGETFDELMWAGFKRNEQETGFRYTGVAAAQMSGTPGTVSEGVLTTLMIQAGASDGPRERAQRLLADSVTTYFVRPVAIDAELALEPSVLEMSRKSAEAGNSADAMLAERRLRRSCPCS